MSHPQSTSCFTRLKVALFDNSGAKRSGNISHTGLLYRVAIFDLIMSRPDLTGLIQLPVWWGDSSEHGCSFSGAMIVWLTEPPIYYTLSRVFWKQIQNPSVMTAMKLLPRCLTWRGKVPDWLMPELCLDLPFTSCSCWNNWSVFRLFHEAVQYTAFNGTGNGFLLTPPQSPLHICWSPAPLSHLCPIMCV